MSTLTASESPAWAVASLPPIENPNSSGQGYCPAHQGHPLHEVAVAFGYTYSHSTPFTKADNRRAILHTYKARPGEREEHNLSFEACDVLHTWETSVSCASGRKCHGSGRYALEKHLASKARRYGIAKAKG